MPHPGAADRDHAHDVVRSVAEAVAQLLAPRGVGALCVPNAVSQPGGYALGAQAGEAAIRQVVTDAGFTRFRRVAETPFNHVYEARP
ncbi:hypothetical protein [Nocardioides pinisoli]|uniref:Macro domain-containing protein n=1 Tax=Nocardioides pinisoli TaxID=2950279 RepID=A0ABT1L1Q4_9ACTN|nr:hypothetical protein [Nocardioides pinisoli]MCP3423964.1 hypothetical protein [Nocardioides pinisoli]